MQSTDFSKSSGIITMEIEKFSEFVNGNEDDYQLSDPIYIRGLPWKIFACPYKPGINLFPRGLSSQKCLDFFLHCNVENEGCVKLIFIFILKFRRKLALPCFGCYESDGTKGRQGGFCSGIPARFLYREKGMGLSPIHGTGSK